MTVIRSMTLMERVGELFDFFQDSHSESDIREELNIFIHDQEIVMGTDAETISDALEAFRRNPSEGLRRTATGVERLQIPGFVALFNGVINLWIYHNH